MDNDFIQDTVVIIGLLRDYVNANAQEISLLEAQIKSLQEQVEKLSRILRVL